MNEEPIYKPTPTDQNPTCWGRDQRKGGGASRKKQCGGGSDLVPLQESALRRYETLGTLGQGGHSLADLGWPHHAYSLHMAAESWHKTMQNTVPCKRWGSRIPFPAQRNFLAHHAPPTPGLPVDGALVQGRRFPAITTQLGVHTPSLTPTAPGALLRAEIQGGLSRSQLRFLMRAVLETAEKEAAASAVVSLHSASALRSTGDRQQPTSPAMDG